LFNCGKFLTTRRAFVNVTHFDSILSKFVLKS
jgi:hypothetical protein